MLSSHSTRLFRALLRARPFSTAAPDPTPALRISPSAIARLRLLRARALTEAAPGALPALRVRVDGGGCSGFKYEFLVERAPLASDDTEFGAAEGAPVHVDAASLDFLRGATLEWEESMMRSAFTISANPNAEASCGCKASFSLKPAAA